MGFYFSKSPLAFAQNLNWVRQIPGTGSDYVKSIATDGGPHLYVVGGFAGTINFNPNLSAGPAVGSDIWFGKYSTVTNSFVWAHALIGGDDDFGTDIILDNTGNVYITGYFGTTTAQLDFDPGPATVYPTVSHGLFLAKYSNNGAFQWRITIGAHNVTTRSNAIAIDDNGNVYIGGTIWSSQNRNVDFNPGPNVFNLNTGNGSIFFAKYNANGQLLWAGNVGPSNSGGDLWDLFVDASKNVYITGLFSGTADFHPTGTSPILNSVNGSAYVCKYSPTGSFVWSKQVQGQNGDIGRHMAVDGSGNVYVTGSLNANGGNIFLAKFSSVGNQLELKSIGGSNSDTGQSILLDGSGNLYLAGYFNGNNIEFNPNADPKTLTSTGSFHNFFYGKYGTSNLHCQWVRRVDFNLQAPDYQINAIRIVNNKLVLAGNMAGNGDFTTCGDHTNYNASNIDGFLIGYNFSDAPFLISGVPAEICEPGPITFQAHNVPLGATVTWAASPGTLVNPASGTGTSFTVNVPPGVSGFVTVTATITGECAASASDGFFIGLPDGTACTPGNIVVEPCHTLYAETCSGGPLYNWYIDGNPVQTSSEFFTYISLVSNYIEPGLHTLCVAYANSCGETQQACTSVYVGSCGSGPQYAMGYPNPTREEINFVLEPGAKENVDFEYSYVLIDKNGAAVKQGTSSKNQLIIDVRDLKKDTYIFKVRLPRQRIEQRIIIN